MPEPTDGPYRWRWRSDLNPPCWTAETDDAGASVTPHADGSCDLEIWCFRSRNLIRCESLPTVEAAKTLAAAELGIADAGGEG